MHVIQTVSAPSAKTGSAGNFATTAVQTDVTTHDATEIMLNVPLDVNSGIMVTTVVYQVNLDGRARNNVLKTAWNALVMSITSHVKDAKTNFTGQNVRMHAHRIAKNAHGLMIVKFAKNVFMEQNVNTNAQNIVQHAIRLIRVDLVKPVLVDKHVKSVVQTTVKLVITQKLAQHVVKGFRDQILHARV
ncbi:hypothetical protein DPMN_068912 [Dreissena polymorpha]|uniref:Uncharacterized protein n=1 Tax=Dreissena polymorpha TaxID=45954 RepID=A0A9D3Z0L3_DREPO|nr:hypothetical protein DPMN_068912 [Dreissena polymorpha]